MNLGPFSLWLIHPIIKSYLFIALLKRAICVFMTRVWNGQFASSWREFSKKIRNIFTMVSKQRLYQNCFGAKLWALPKNIFLISVTSYNWCLINLCKRSICWREYVAWFFIFLGLSGSNMYVLLQKVRSANYFSVVGKINQLLLGSFSLLYSNWVC